MVTHDLATAFATSQRFSLIHESRLDASGIHARGDVVISLEFPLADMILNRACEESCDLLVMGAFRGDRPALGKIARHVLQHMTLPVLMSH